MKAHKLFFLLSLFGVLLIMFVGETFGETFEGEILEIKSFGSGISIIVEGVPERVILFSKEIISLNIGDYIYFNGKRDFYQGENQIILRKVWRV